MLKDIGITFPSGFKANGCHVGLKKKKMDMSVVFSKKEADLAAVFTTNKVKAAPVLWNESVHTKGNKVRGIIINSGNANACTGDEGITNTETMAEKTANCLNIQKQEVLVASTGVIGVPLPMDKILNGIEIVTKQLYSDNQGSILAATGIMTTDTYIKQGAIEVSLSTGKVKIGGMAKGSGMIHPNMATMLSFITTDAKISKTLLQRLLLETTNETYNMISVDGDTSTNDMVLVLANGASDTDEIIEGTKDFELFKEAFKELNKYLAVEIVRDGEGAGKLIEVIVNGAYSTKDARLLAKSIISSNLVKTAFFGADANWGRVVCSMGYSGGNFDNNGLSITFQNERGSIEVYRNGLPITFDEDIAFNILKDSYINLLVQLNDGNGCATAWGCDLSYEYVKINGEYRT